MKYYISLIWNSTIVLQGTCTASMAWDILRAFSGNFVNAEKAGFEIPTLVDLANAKEDQFFSGRGEERDDARNSLGEGVYYLTSYQRGAAKLSTNSD